MADKKTILRMKLCSSERWRKNLDRDGFEIDVKVISFGYRGGGTVVVQVFCNK